MPKKTEVGKYKNAAVLISIIALSTIMVMKEIPQTESADPLAFFTLQAWVKTTEQMDIFNLIKQQLTRIGVNLEFITHGPFQWDQSGMYDLEIYDISVDEFYDPFYSEFYAENGYWNYASYDVGLDWDDQLNTGRNQWYIENGLEMISNNSQEVVSYCWEWQTYLQDRLTLCLPLFTKKNNSDYYQVLFYNVKETHPYTGNRQPSPLIIENSIGLSIRKAVSYAINREEIRKVVLGDEYMIIDHPINPFLGNWCNPNVPRYCHDLFVARSYLTSAGFDVCGDPDTGDSFPDWTDWEAVCSRNEQSIDVSGFTIIIASICLTTIVVTSTIIYKKEKNRLISKEKFRGKK